MTLNRRRGFIRTTSGSDDALDRWSLPSYDEDKEFPKNTAMNYDPGWEPPQESEGDQDAEPQIDISMLTADALDKIRQSAVDEGMEQGKEAGFKEGREAGFEEGKTAGFGEGKAAGLEEGLSEGKEEIQNHCRHLDSMLEKLAFPIQQINEQVQQQVMDLVLALTKAVIGTEALTNPKVILNTVHETVNALPMTGRKITVYLHPDDLDIVKSAHTKDALEQRDWQLISEPALHRGDIQVASGDSVVDFKLEDRIAQVLARFAGQNRPVEPKIPENGMGKDVLIAPDKLQPSPTSSVEPDSVFSTSSENEKDPSLSQDPPQTNAAQSPENHQSEDLKSEEAKPADLKETQAKPIDGKSKEPETTDAPLDKAQSEEESSQKTKIDSDDEQPV